MCRWPLPGRSHWVQRKVPGCYSRRAYWTGWWHMGCRLDTSRLHRPWPRWQGPGTWLHGHTSSMPLPCSSKVPAPTKLYTCVIPLKSVHILTIAQCCSILHIVLLAWKRQVQSQLVRHAGAMHGISTRFSILLLVHASSLKRMAQATFGAI